MKMGSLLARGQKLEMRRRKVKPEKRERKRIPSLMQGKTYRLTVSGKKKTDTIAETKYEYNEKNELVALIDPEGRRESYSYDENSNLTKTVDKNGNTLKKHL